MSLRPMYARILYAQMYITSMPAQYPIVYSSYPFASMMASPVEVQAFPGVQVRSRPCISFNATPTNAYLR